MRARQIVVAALLLTLISVPATTAAGITVSAAASLTDVLREIATEYQREHGDVIAFNFGASSILARQIQEGAPADLFISADEIRMDQLEQHGLIIVGTRRSLLSNTLVIIVPGDSGLKIRSARDLAATAIRNIAVAEPSSVPAGIYAKEYLSKLGVWKSIEARIIPAENVRSALAAVESGNVDCGIVYKTDAMISKAVKIAYEVPVAEGPKISYPAAVVKDTKQEPAARRFLDYLRAPKARAIFAKYGFIVR